MHGGGVAQLAATFAAANAVVAQAQTFGFQQRFIEGGEIQSLTTIFLGAHIAAATNQVGFGDVAKFLDFGQQFRTGEHGEGLNPRNNNAQPVLLHPLASNSAGVLRAVFITPALVASACASLSVMRNALFFVRFSQELEWPRLPR